MSDSESAAPTSQRLSSLDGLRALAALLVVIYHAALFGKGFPESWLPIAKLLPSGRWAVQLFFFISGFVITHLLLKEEQKNGRIHLGFFMIRRGLRLLPVYWLYIAVAYSASLIGSEPIELTDYVASMTFTYSCWNHASSYVLSHFWSLAVEEQFYLIWPVLLVLVRRNRSRELILAAIVLLFPLVRGAVRRVCGGDFAAIPLFSNSDNLAFGCLLAFCLERGSRIADRFTFVPLALIEIGLAIFIVIEQHLFHTGKLGHLTIAFSYAHNVALFLFLGLVVVKPTLPIAGVLNWRPFAALGLISYSLYIWQQLFTQPYLGEKGLWAFVFPWNCLVALLCATMSYHWIEKPLLSLKRFFKPVRASG